MKSRFAIPPLQGRPDPVLAVFHRIMRALYDLLGSEGMGNPRTACGIVRDELQDFLGARNYAPERLRLLHRCDDPDTILATIVTRCACRLLEINASI